MGAFQRLERSHNKVILRELGVGNNENYESCIRNGDSSSVVEQQSVKLLAVGSIPTYCSTQFGLVAHLVERTLDKREVNGSNPFWPIDSSVNRRLVV